MDKLRALRDRYRNRNVSIDRAEAFVLALEVLDVVNVITDALVDGQLDAAEAAAIAREVSELRAVVAEALAD
tara:strand:- start:356 stop:571 length:216 start_codon:yes stop_codon:yes gene_type:complete